MAAAETGAVNRALHPDPRLLHLRAALLHVPTHLRVHHLLHAAETVILVWDDLAKTLVLGEEARAVEALNLADHREIGAAHPAAVVPKAADHLVIAEVLPVEALNQAVPAEIVVARLQEVQLEVAEAIAVWADLPPMAA
ncbi:MAG: hypothetical protein WCK51_08915 [Armatimonadota bacterium]